MARIDLTRISEDERAYRFRVTVSEADGESNHQVGLSKEDLKRLGTGSESPDQFVRRCFEYLLEREPKESIMARFDVADIDRFFPNFREEIRRPVR